MKKTLIISALTLVASGGLCFGQGLETHGGQSESHLAGEALAGSGNRHPVGARGGCLYRGAQRQSAADVESARARPLR